MGLEMLGAFTAGLLLITISELGDKSFFISLCLAMRYPRRWVFVGSATALALMTVLSVLMGQAIALVSKDISRWGMIALFVFFGVKLLWDAWQMGDGSTDEVQREAIEAIEADRKSLGSAWAVVSQSFGLTFLAEWGDRTQFATISLAAAQNPVGVVLGATLGHAICSAIAVYVGKAIAAKLSEKVITAIGGVLFLIFAAWAAVIPG